MRDVVVVPQRKLIGLGPEFNMVMVVMMMRFVALPFEGGGLNGIHTGLKVYGRWRPLETVARTLVL